MPPFEAAGFMSHLGSVLGKALTLPVRFLRHVFIRARSGTIRPQRRTSNCLSPVRGRLPFRCSACLSKIWKLSSMASSTRQCGRSRRCWATTGSLSPIRCQRQPTEPNCACFIPTAVCMRPSTWSSHRTRWSNATRRVTLLTLIATR